MMNSDSPSDAVLLVHELDRAYRSCIDGDSHPQWDDAPFWQRDFAERCVHNFSRRKPPSDIHFRWLVGMREDGWVYGSSVDEKERTHPMVLGFNQLPASQRMRYHIIHAALSGICGLLDERKVATALGGCPKCF